MLSMKKSLLINIRNISPVFYTAYTFLLCAHEVITSAVFRFDTLKIRNIVFSTLLLDICCLRRLFIILMLSICSLTSAYAKCSIGPSLFIAEVDINDPKYSISHKICGALGGDYNVLVGHQNGNKYWCTDGTADAEEIRVGGSSAAGVVLDRLYYESTDSTETLHSSYASCNCPPEEHFNVATQMCEPVKYYLSEPTSGNSCDKEGNPCNPVTGDKSQVETDLVLYGSGLSFERFYQSQSLGDGFKGLGNNWRHSFTPRIDSYEKVANYDDFPAIKSDLYPSDYEACLAGWSDVKTDIFRGELATNSLVYFRGGTCKIEINGEVISTFSIQSTKKFVYLQSVIKKTVSRPNGNTITFRKNGEIWQPTNPSVATLEELTDSWKYTDVDNTVELYNLDGQLQSSTILNGFSTSFSYDGSGRLGAVTGPFGHQFTFNYDNQYRIEKVTTPLGDITYGYDGNNNLDTVTYPDSRVKQYHYEDANFLHHLTGITDENNVRYATWEYDSQGRATISEHSGGVERVEFVYSPDGTTIVTDSRGSNRIYQNAMSGGELMVDTLTGVPCIRCANGQMKERNYDTDGNLIEFTDWQGAITQFGGYDVKRQYAYMIEAVGTPDERRTDYIYDPRFINKVTTKIEPSVFAGNNKVMTTVFDDFGNQTSTVIDGFDVSGNTVSRTTTRQYTGPLNQLSFIDGPRTEVNDYTYYHYYPNDATEGNNRGRLKEVEDAIGVQLQSGIQYTRTGKVQSEIRPNGLSISYDYYNGSDRLETLTETTINGSRTTKWTYLASGEVETITTAFGSLDTTTLMFGYDGARRLNKITDGLGNYMEYVLDTEGNREEEKIFDMNGVLKRQLTKTFDIYNSLDISSQENEVRNSNFSIDGTLDLEIDGSNITTDYSYDNLKRLTSIKQDAGGTSPQTANALTTLNYDVQNNLTYVKNPVDGETIYIYDDLGNRLTRSSDDTGLTIYDHDEAGNIILMTDANGEVINYRYDALNRLTSVVPGNVEEEYLYEYDNCVNGVGRLCKISNASSVQHYAYDAFGNIEKQQALQYTYDIANRLKTIIYPSGATLVYEYDVAGQVQNVLLDRNGIAVPLATNINYDPFGDLNNIIYGSGLTLSQSKDSAYRPVSQSILNVFEFDYVQYDANGNLTQRVDALNASNDVFTYDEHDRLETATGAFGTRAYSYDKNANRESVTIDGFQTVNAYDIQSNRLSMRGVDTAVLDNNGDTLSIGDRSYSYTKHNQLFEVFDNGVLKATYQYNGLGQRISKTLPDGTGKYFLYDTDGKLMVETDTNGNALFEYLYLNGQLLAKYTPDTDFDGISNYEEDKQGTNSLSPDSDGDGLSDLDEIFIHGTLLGNTDSDGDGVTDMQEVVFNSDPVDSNVNYGDVNLNGEFNLGDYVLLMQYVLGTSTPNPTEQEQADLNQDGILNIQDMLIMQRVLLRLQISWLDFSVENFENLFAQLYKEIMPPAYAANGDGEIYYVHNDHLGAPVKMTNELGFVVWQATYDPFGKASVDEDVDLDGEIVEMNVRLPGQYYDSESELHYNYFRTYDPKLGRYLTSDPIGLGGGINTYGYVRGNAINSVDPIGLWALSIQAYAGPGGAVKIIYSEGTLEVTGRIGVGLGVGIEFDPVAEVSPHSKDCGNGYIARTTLQAGTSYGLGVAGVGVGFIGSSGNAVTHKVGGGYVEISGPNISTNGESGFGFNATINIGVDVGSYTNW